MQASTKKALKILKKDRVRNANIINFMNHYPVERIHIYKESVLVQGRSDQLWTYISSDKKEELEGLVKEVPFEIRHFAILEDWMLPLVVGKRKILWKLSCLKLYFPEEKELPENKVPMEPLPVSATEYIYDHSSYKQYTSREYIQERIEKGTGLGIYQGDQLVAWVLTHDDGALGFLTVLPQYQGKGYAKEVTVAAIKELRKKGAPAFVHIEPDNPTFLALSRKLGFVEDRRIHWIKVGKAVENPGRD